MLLFLLICDKYTLCYDKPCEETDFESLVQRKSVHYSLLSKGVTNNKQLGICYVFVANKTNGLQELSNFSIQ